MAGLQVERVWERNLAGSLCCVPGQKISLNLPLSYQEVEWYQRTAGKPDEKIRVGWGKLGGGVTLG